MVQRLISSYNLFLNKYRSSSNVFKASIWFVAVSFIDKAVNVLTQPFVYRMLTVEEAGICNIYNTWLSIILIISTFYLFCGSLEILITNHKNESKSISGSLSILSSIIFLLFFSVFFLFSNQLSHWMELKPKYLVCMACSIWAQAIIQFWCVPKRFEYSYKQYSALTLVLFISKALLSVVLTYLMCSDRVYGRILGLCIPQVIIALWTVPSLIRPLVNKKITKYWKQALLLAVPLIPHYLSQILLASSDRVMIQKLSGDYSAGLYSVAYSFSSLSLMVFTAINSAYSPYAYAAIRDKEYEGLKKRTNSLVIVSIAFSLVLIFMAPEGLFVLGGEKYLKSASLVPVLIVGIFLSSSYFIFSNVEFVYEKTKYVFPITASGAILNIVLNWALIPALGFQVAAFTTFIGYLLIAVLHYCISKRIVKEEMYDMKTIICLFIAFIIIACVASALYNYSWIYRYCVIALLIMIVLFLIKRGVINIK